MTIVLDHTIVLARDAEASARFLASVFGLRYDGLVSRFANDLCGDCPQVCIRPEGESTRSVCFPHQRQYGRPGP